jgi:hypothetical protein
MPTHPTPNFIVIHTQFVLAFFQGRFHRPTKPTHANQLGVRT